MLKELLRQNRSYRRFYQETEITRKELEDILDHVRYTPSTANLQPLRYYFSNENNLNARVFSTLRWAGYLKEWSGPAEGERPAAYIVIVSNKPQVNLFDPGIALLAILLAAAEKGFGGCTFASIDKHELREIFNIGEEYEVQLVIALGKPKEQVVIEDISNSQDIKYWRDGQHIHHVPKIVLNDLLLN